MNGFNKNLSISDSNAPFFYLILNHGEVSVILSVSNGIVSNLKASFFIGGSFRLVRRDITALLRQGFETAAKINVCIYRLT